MDQTYTRCFSTKQITVSSHRDLRMIFALYSFLSFSKSPTLFVFMRYIHPFLYRLKTCNFNIFIFKNTRLHLCIPGNMPHQYSQPPHACHYRYLLMLRILFHNTLIHSCFLLIVCYSHPCGLTQHFPHSRRPFSGYMTFTITVLSTLITRRN